LQVPKRHLPIVGILGLVLIAAAGGGIYYYQFLQPHAAPVPPSHRLVFMTAIVEEEGGYHVTSTAFLNQTTLPAFNSTKGANMTGVQHQNYVGAADNKTIDAHTGDTITFYILGENATSTDLSLHLSNAHGFQISGPGSVNIQDGTLPGTIPFGKWYTVTVTFQTAGTYVYFCTINCSPLHGNMNGQIVVT
jgi:plastocyanin